MRFCRMNPSRGHKVSKRTISGAEALNTTLCGARVPFAFIFDNLEGPSPGEPTEMGAIKCSVEHR